jgi:hypothetical protein
MAEAMNETYRATVTREGDAWVVETDVPGAHTWAPTLGKVRAYAAEAISVMLDQDVDPDQVTVDVVVDGVSTAECADAARRLAETADQAVRKATEVNKATVARLADAGASVREIAPLVGLSPARVHQLLTQ